MSQLQQVNSSKGALYANSSLYAAHATTGDSFLAHLCNALTALILLPIIFLCIAMTLLYIYGICWTGLMCLFNWDTFLGVAVALTVAALSMTYQFKIRVNQGEKDSQTKVAPPEVLGRSFGQTTVGLYSTARPLVMLSLPGPLCGLLMLMASQIPYSFYCFLDNSVKTMFGALLAVVPLMITWTICEQLKQQQFVGQQFNFFVLKNAEWKSVMISEIVEVDVRPLESISEKHFDEEDQSHYAITVKQTRGYIVDIPLATPYSNRDRRMIFDWFESHVDAALFTARAARFIQKPKVEAKKPSAEPAPALSTREEVSLTALWQSDFNAHMTRTNYAPLQQGHLLQDGKFTVLGYLSSGGFCTTYLCRNQEGEKVVLKESSLPAGLSNEAKARTSSMFQREARMLQRCTHARIARIFDSFNENDREYLVLEFIDGVPLSHMVRNSGAIEEKQALLWLMQMADFLKHLHGLEPPVIHRDFTPENLIVHKSGDLYLIDFGAANDFIGQATGTLIGKQSYIAPEQLQGKACQQSDIYAFGATAYFLLTGKEPMPLSEMAPDNCSDALRKILLDCTRFEKIYRIESASEVMSRLDELN